MPQINKKPILILNKTQEKSKERHKLYNLQQWRNLREIFKQSHPLCSECLKHNIITAENLDVHHILSPFDPNISEMEKYHRLLDYNNLQTLCKTCHQQAHLKKKLDSKPKI
jgi:5-methylcytosine-specific restriction protein A